MPLSQTTPILTQHHPSRLCRDLRVSLAGRDLPEDVKARLLDLQDEKLSAESEVKALLARVKTAEDHVQKAKKVGHCIFASPERVRE